MGTIDATREIKPAGVRVAVSLDGTKPFNSVVRRTGLRVGNPRPVPQ